MNLERPQILNKKIILFMYEQFTNKKSHQLEII